MSIIAVIIGIVITVWTSVFFIADLTEGMVTQIGKQFGWHAVFLTVGILLIYLGNVL